MTTTTTYILHNSQTSEVVGRFDSLYTAIEQAHAIAAELGNGVVIWSAGKVMARVQADGTFQDLLKYQR